MAGIEWDHTTPEERDAFFRKEFSRFGPDQSSAITERTLLVAKSKNDYDYREGLLTRKEFARKQCNIYLIGVRKGYWKDDPT